MVRPSIGFKAATIIVILNANTMNRNNLLFQRGPNRMMLILHTNISGQLDKLQFGSFGVHLMVLSKNSFHFTERGRGGGGEKWEGRCHNFDITL